MPLEMRRGEVMVITVFLNPGHLSCEVGYYPACNGLLMPGVATMTPSLSPTTGSPVTGLASSDGTAGIAEN